MNEPKRNETKRNETKRKIEQNIAHPLDSIFVLSLGFRCFIFMKWIFFETFWTMSSKCVFLKNVFVQNAGLRVQKIKNKFLISAWIASTAKTTTPNLHPIPLENNNNQSFVLPCDIEIDLFIVYYYYLLFKYSILFIGNILNDVHILTDDLITLHQIAHIQNTRSERDRTIKKKLN